MDSICQEIPGKDFALVTNVEKKDSSYNAKGRDVILMRRTILGDGDNKLIASVLYEAQAMNLNNVSRVCMN